MATVTWNVGFEVYNQKPGLGSVPLQIARPNEYRFELGTYSLTFFGQGIESRTLPGGFLEILAGAVTRIEERDGGRLLLSIEDLSAPAAAMANVKLHGLFPTFLAGGDTVNGSPFADRISGYGGADILNGGAGNDTFFDLGSTQIDGGQGLDTFEVTNYNRSDVTLTRTASDTWRVAYRTDSLTDVLRNIEYVKLADTTISLLDLALGAPIPPDLKGTQVFRFAKLDSGQYFYTGSVGERDLIVTSMPNFRYEGPVFFAQDNWVTNFNPVYRFANLVNGGYFYTASAAERDSVISDYPSYRYEGASFFVPASASADTVPVFRLANTRTGGYLFTSNPAERQYAQSLGFFRDEGIAFNAPRTISLVDGGDSGLASIDDVSLAISGASPDGAGWSDWIL